MAAGKVTACCSIEATPRPRRLVWTLPGKTRIVCHLKDKDKIRHKKRSLTPPAFTSPRWSQIMYMYYLLGYKLMELPISDERKEVKLK
jgi:chitin synthase